MTEFFFLHEPKTSSPQGSVDEHMFRRSSGHDGQSRPRLLVIDDEPAVAGLVERTAQGCGYDVTAVSTVEEFSAALGTNPEFIVIDLALRGTDGVELLRQLARGKCRAAILIVSGFDTRVLETAGRLGSALGLNVVGTLPKPVRVSELRSRLSPERPALGWAA